MDKSEHSTITTDLDQWIKTYWREYWRDVALIVALLLSLVDFLLFTLHEHGHQQGAAQVRALSMVTPEEEKELIDQVDRRAEAIAYQATRVAEAEKNIQKAQIRQVTRQLVTAGSSDAELERETRRVLADLGVTNIRFEGGGR